MYPATSRFLEFVPEPLLAGVMGGVGFLCLALILVLGTVCIFSHKRDQRRRKMKDGETLSLTDHVHYEHHYTACRWLPIHFPKS